jgi:hypothetical protein
MPVPSPGTAKHIESTPAVWRGWLYLGTRDGYFYAVR